MKSGTKKLKIIILAFVLISVIFGFSQSDHFVHESIAFSGGPPAGVTGAPNETNCTVCHSNIAGAGSFNINAPQNYVPGQTYPITVQHTSSDPTRLRWGYQLTSLAGNTFAGSFSNAGSNSQIIDGGNGRNYVQHTSSGTFPGQSGGATWTFNWTAPSTNVGAVTLYAAGNQANNDGSSDGDRILTSTATIQPAPAVNNPPIFDYDGDDKTDIGIFRPAPAEWWYVRSSDGGNRAFQFGSTTDKLVPADFTGDGKTDIAFWRPSSGQWFVLRSENLSFFAFPFGANGDVPVPADFDGDGKADAAVFRPSSNTWFIQRSSGGTTITQFGITGDVPAVADYDGDGKADIAIFRPAAGEWWIQRSAAGLLALQFGISSDKIVQGDYTGDGKADIAFWRPSTGTWFVLRSENLSFFSAPFGANSDMPAPGDYDGDGQNDLAVFRPSNSTWFIQRSTQGTLITTFGISGDIPIQSAFIP